MGSRQPEGEFLSLLWPAEADRITSIGKINENDPIIKDLELESICRAIRLSSRYSVSIEQLNSLFTESVDTIKYRQEIIRDLIDAPELVNCFSEILPKLDELAAITITKRGDSVPLQQMVLRLGELDLYAECVIKLKAALNEAGSVIRSEGLKCLWEEVSKICSEESFKTITEEIPKMRAGFREIASVTIGVNLDVNLKPVEATIISIDKERFKGKASILNRLFNKTDDSAFTGMGSLLRIENLSKPGERPVYDPFQVALFDQLNVIVGSIARPIESVINKYTSISSVFLTSLRQDIIFLLGAVKLVNKLQNTGMPVCKPQIAEKKERVFEVRDIYNFSLAMHKHYKTPDLDLSTEIVTNNVEMGENGRIFILTGPNRGGKTTYIQAIGVAQYMFQLGLYITGSKAVLSPSDKIFSHFPVEEKPNSSLGRLGEESKRLNDIIRHATRHSMILLNESLCSTSFEEGSYISREIIAGLRMMGARAIFATHFHSLAKNPDIFNLGIPGESKVLSMVSGVAKKNLTGKGDINLEPAKRTYVIEPGPPQGLSYARDIAGHFGISLENIIKTLKERSVINVELDTGSLTKQFNSED